MRIANPIYDAVFKYLLEDREIAKGLISEIIGEEITELELKPQEHFKQSIEYQVVIFRLDFKATIKTKEGEYKKILIELQKGKYLADIVRFRRYLGDNYRKEDEVREKSGRVKKTSLPIITIYFLGFKLKNVKTSALKVNRVYKDILTQKELKVKEAFVEQLTHDSYVIQIPRLNPITQTKLEKVLSVFNQIYKSSDEDRILEYRAEEADEGLIRKIVDRLMRAAADEDLLLQMEVEEEVERTIEKHIREKEDLKDRLNKEKEDLKDRLNKEKEDLKDQLNKEKEDLKDQLNKEKEGLKDQLNEEQEKLEEKNRAMEEKDRLIAELKKRLKDDN